MDRHPQQGDTHPSTLRLTSFFLGLSDVLNSTETHRTPQPKAIKLIYIWKDTKRLLKMEDGGHAHIK